jgi:DNA-damage-inducible protein J
MGKTAFVRARIDPILKKEVESMFDKWGITTTQAISMLYKQIKNTHSFPLSLRFNSETERAIKEAKEGKGVKSFNTSQEMFKALGMPMRHKTPRMAAAKKVSKEKSKTLRISTKHKNMKKATPGK